MEAHGSFASQRCIDCGTEFPDTLMKKAIEAKEVPRCLIETCNGFVKPDIVFFGEPLTEAFHRNRTLPASADLAIVMGTSLTVQPFASLPSFVREEVPRILINFERVGGLGSRADDVLFLDDCDVGVRKLAHALGWLDELEELWQQTNPSRKNKEGQQMPSKTRDEKLEEGVDQLTRDIDKTLKLSKDHNTWLQDHLKDNNKLDQDDSAVWEDTAPVSSTSAKDDDENGPRNQKASNDSETQTDAAERAPKDATEEAIINGSDNQSIKEQKIMTKATDENNEDQSERREYIGLDHVFPHRDKTSEKP